MDREQKLGKINKFGRGLAITALFLTSCSPDTGTRIIIPADTSPNRIPGRIIKGNGFTIEEYSANAFTINPGGGMEMADNFQRGYRYVDTRCNILGVINQYGSGYNFPQVLIVKDGACLAELQE